MRVSIRVSNHHANAGKYLEHDPNDFNLSIMVSKRYRKKHLSGQSGRDIGGIRLYGTSAGDRGKSVLTDCSIAGEILGHRRIYGHHRSCQGKLFTTGEPLKPAKHLQVSGVQHHSPQEIPPLTPFAAEWWLVRCGRRGNKGSIGQTPATASTPGRPCFPFYPSCTVHHSAGDVRSRRNLRLARAGCFVIRNSSFTVGLQVLLRFTTSTPDSSPNCRLCFGRASHPPPC